MEAAEVVLLVLLHWQLPPAERDALLGACTRAFAPGVCEEADPDAEVSASWTAQVEHTAPGELLLRVRGGDGPEELERRLSFLPADTELEQAKAWVAGAA